ncbi:hypothetical protein BDN70DRAFT_831326 [Pholiota conissans]|uniref:F-box domain-containing protein n=1 Tax=Pholiota conissans TaxID=109636 RepID=A0A9P6D2R3_9AGAR|nr:hypothetical protein BDN70DRAFT_831326 [Pholiota conissans]
MDRCPPEICSEIYAFACLDGGRTGRSLSLVSKFTNETSKPYKLQSISLIGHAQIYAFADLVERTPEHLRRVKSIFVSAHSRETAILPRAVAPEYHRRSEVYAALKRILTAIAPCVEIAHVFLVFFRPFVLLPVSLPHLEELVIHGAIEPSTTPFNPQIYFPSLKYLWLTSSGSPTFLLQKVLPVAPILEQLRLSEIKSEIHAEDWKRQSSSTRRIRSYDVRTT